MTILYSVFERCDGVIFNPLTMALPTKWQLCEMKNVLINLMVVNSQQHLPCIKSFHSTINSNLLLVGILTTLCDAQEFFLLLQWYHMWCWGLSHTWLVQDKCLTPVLSLVSKYNLICWLYFNNWIREREARINSKSKVLFKKEI